MKAPTSERRLPEVVASRVIAERQQARAAMRSEGMDRSMAAPSAPREGQR